MNLKVTKLTISHKGEKTDVTRETLPELKTNRQWREHTSRRSYSLPEKETPAGKTRVFVHVAGEDLWDDFVNRTSRPHTLWAPIVRQALIDAGFPETVRLRWSQKAGCSCPCSPAFFVTGGPKGLDLWVTVEADAPQRTGDLEAASRGAQLAAQL